MSDSSKVNIGEWILKILRAPQEEVPPFLPIRELGPRYKRILWLSLFQAMDRGGFPVSANFTPVFKKMAPHLILDDRIDDRPVLGEITQLALTNPKYYDFLSELLCLHQGELRNKPWTLPSGDSMRMWGGVSPGEKWAYDLATHVLTMGVLSKKGGTTVTHEAGYHSLENALVSLLGVIPQDTAQHWRIYLWQNILLYEGMTGRFLPRAKKVLLDLGIIDYPIHRPVSPYHSDCEFVGGVELLLKHLESHPLLLKTPMASSGWSTVFKECVQARQRLSKTEELPGTDKLWQQLLSKTASNPGWSAALESLYLQYASRSVESPISTNRRM